MKRMMVIGFCAALIGGAAVTAVHAGPPPEGPGAGIAADGGDGPRRGRGEGKRGFQEFGRKQMRILAQKLGLSEEQKGKVRELLEAERKSTRPLHDQLTETRRKLRDLVETVPFDEGAARGVIAASEGTRTELMLSHARTRSQIFNLLTPEQKEKAKKLRLPLPEGPQGAH